MNDLKELLRKEFRSIKEYKSSIIEGNEEEYKKIYSEFAEVVDAYFAPSYKQAHEDLHLWFRSRNNDYEFLLTDIFKTNSFFEETKAILVEDIKEMELYIEVSKNKNTSNKIVSKVIIEHPLIGEPDTCYFLDYDN